MSSIKEISKRTGVLPMHVGLAKKKMFGKDHEMSNKDWKRLEKSFLEKKEKQEDTVTDENDDLSISEKVDVYVSYVSDTHKNYVEIKCPDRIGKRFWMNIPYGLETKGLVGSKVRAERITYKGQEYYRHGLLSINRFSPRYYKGYEEPKQKRN